MITEDMDGEEGNSKKGIVLELQVYMHCKACERSVLNTLKKLKGVNSVKVDMGIHRAIVTGEVDEEIAVKKLKKKIGKRAEIINKNVDNAEKDNAEKDNVEEIVLSEDNNDRHEASMDALSNGFDEKSIANFNMFSDENPNSCSIM